MLIRKNDSTNDNNNINVISNKKSIKDVQKQVNQKLELIQNKEVKDYSSPYPKDVNVNSGIHDKSGQNTQFNEFNKFNEIKSSIRSDKSRPEFAITPLPKSKLKFGLKLNNKSKSGKKR